MIPITARREYTEKSEIDRLLMDKNFLKAANANRDSVMKQFEDILRLTISELHDVERLPITLNPYMIGITYVHRFIRIDQLPETPTSAKGVGFPVNRLPMNVILDKWNKESLDAGSLSGIVFLLDMAFNTNTDWIKKLMAEKAYPIGYEKHKAENSQKNFGASLFVANKMVVFAINKGIHNNIKLNAQYLHLFTLSIASTISEDKSVTVTTRNYSDLMSIGDTLCPRNRLISDEKRISLIFVFGFSDYETDRVTFELAEKLGTSNYTVNYFFFNQHVHDKSIFESREAWEQKLNWIDRQFDRQEFLADDIITDDSDSSSTPLNWSFILSPINKVIHEIKNEMDAQPVIMTIPLCFPDKENKYRSKVEHQKKSEETCQEAPVKNQRKKSQAGPSRENPKDKLETGRQSERNLRSTSRSKSRSKSRIGTENDPEHQPDNQPERRSRSKSISKSTTKSKTHAGSKSKTKPEQAEEIPPQDQSGRKSRSKSVSKPVSSARKLSETEKPVDKPEKKQENLLEPQPESVPERRARSKSVSKPVSSARKLSETEKPVNKQEKKQENLLEPQPESVPERRARSKSVSKSVKQLQGLAIKEPTILVKDKPVRRPSNVPERNKSVRPSVSISESNSENSSGDKSGSKPRSKSRVKSEKETAGPSGNPMARKTVRNSLSVSEGSSGSQPEHQPERRSRSKSKREPVNKLKSQPRNERGRQPEQRSRSKSISKPVSKAVSKSESGSDESKSEKRSRSKSQSQSRRKSLLKSVDKPQTESNDQLQTKTKDERQEKPEAVPRRGPMSGIANSERSIQITRRNNDDKNLMDFAEVIIRILRSLD